MSLDYRQYALSPSDYVDKKFIGKGSIGEIYKVRKNRTTDFYAYRLIKTPNSQGSTSESAAFMHELDFYTKTKPHPAISRFYGYTLDPPGIVTEFFPNGSLQDLIKRPQNEIQSILTPTRRAITIFGISSAMMHIHSQGAVHRFLKPSNILFDENWEPHISDFAHARVSVCGPMNSTINSDPTYTAPEVLLGQPFDATVDVYSFAMLLYLLVTATVPFPDAGFSAFQLANEIITHSRRPEVPSDFPPRLARVMARSWASDPLDRPLFSEIVRELLDNDEPLPGVEIEAYDEYRERVFRATTVHEDDRDLFETMHSAEDLSAFQQALKDVENDPNNANARLRLGRMFLSGAGVERSATEAAKHLRVAAGQGNAIAQYNLGMLLEAGRGVNRNEREALELYGKAAEKNLKQAIVAHAHLLEKGGKLAEAAAEAQRAAESAHPLPESLFDWGRMLDDGIGVQQDEIRARHFYQLAGEAGEMTGWCNLATMLIQGRGGPQDIQGAIDAYRKAADKGHFVALYNLGEIYRLPKWGAQNEVKALECFRLAASLDAPSPNSAQNSARNPPNSQNAVGSQNSASSQNSDNSQNCENNQRRGKTKICEKVPGQNCENSQNSEASQNSGNSQPRKKGMPLAAARYAQMIAAGKGAKANPEEAVRYYRYAADRGVAMAQHNLARALAKGEGCDVDLAESARYMKMAADQGTPASMCWWGKYLRDGVGVPVNVEKARIYFQRAAQAGSQEAITILQSF